jgi:hypothetical protein
MSWIVPLIALILIGIGYMMKNHLPSTLTKNLFTHESTLYRLENYRFASHIFLKKPLFGIGLHAPIGKYLASYRQENRPISWPWGLTKESGSGNYGIYLKQPDSREYWLYTGIGDIVRPPSSYFDDSLKIDNSSSGSFRFSANIKGIGYADLYIWWYNLKGEANSFNIGRYYLPEDYKVLKKSFELPREAEEFRISFLLRGAESEPCTLYLDDMIIERNGSEPVIETETSKARKVWRSLFHSHFEGAEPDRKENIGWWTYSEGRPISWPWGLTKESGSGNYGIYLKQPDSREYWLYTGIGDIVRPPSSYFDDSLKIDNSSSGSFRFSANIKGIGYADLYIWWYNLKGEANSFNIGRYYLPEDYKVLKKAFELPREAEEFRISFLLRGTEGEPCTLYLDDMIIESEERELKQEKKASWQPLLKSDFEGVDSDELEDLGWSTCSKFLKHRGYSEFIEEKKTLENMILCGFVEMGGIFSITYIVLILYLLKKLLSFTKDKPKKRQQAVLLLIPLAGFFIHSMIFDSLIYPHLNWLFHSFLGLMANFSKT